jgi:hypothetical protein
VSAPSWAGDRQPVATPAASRPPVETAGDRQVPPLATARETASAPPAAPPAAVPGFGWGRRQAASRQPSAVAHQTASAQQGSAGDVAGDRQDFGLVVASNDHGDATLRAETVSTGELRRHWADTPRAATEHLGSLGELRRYAREAHINFGHIPLVRSASIVFFWGVTTPALILAWPFLWAYVIKFDRALTFFFLTLLVAPPANSLADWLVPDALVWTDWPAGTWQVVAGLALVFVVATVLVARHRTRGPRR